MAKNDSKINEANQAKLYWPGKRTGLEKLVLPFHMNYDRLAVGGGLA